MLYPDYPTTPPAPNVQTSSPLERHGIAQFADRLGAGASFLCAVHCAALPFVLALLPALGLGFLADHGFERGFIVCASALASATLIRGYHCHRISRPLLFLLPGLVLLWVGGFLLDPHASLAFHSTLVALGGSCIALAHLTNLRLAHGHVRETARAS